MPEITCSQAARLWSVTPRRVQMYCAQGRVSGARLVGRLWLIPSDAQKPHDPRTACHSSGLMYWPRLLLLDDNMMKVNSESQMLAYATTAAQEKQLLGEIAYMRGDYPTALKCIEGVNEKDPSYLAALIISAAARISMGDTTSFQETWSILSNLHTRLAFNPDQRILIELAQGTLAISAFAPRKCASWLIDGIFVDLPSSALPMAYYLRGKALLALGRTEQLLGMAEGVLSLLPRGFGIEEAYINIMLAHAYLYQNRVDKVREALMRAIDICLPKGFLSPLAENIYSLMGLGERCLLEVCPEQLPKILSLHKKLSGSWLKIHNILTHEEITTILTRREYQVALCVASGLSNEDSAQKLGISHATLRGHLQNIYQKLNITSRKELRDHIIIA